jgi:hypothetical protein
MAQGNTLLKFPERQQQSSPATAALSLHDEACAYCGALPGERHTPTCPDEMSEIDANEIQFCDACGCSYVTTCNCDDERGR